MSDSGIFTIKKIEGKKGVAPHEEVKENLRKKISKYNAFKHGLRSKEAAIECNNCIFRSKEAGGNGKCKYYEPDSYCDIWYNKLSKMVDDIDPSRKADDLYEILNFIFGIRFKRYMLSEYMTAMAGNISDRYARNDLNALLQVAKMITELHTRKMVLTERETREGDETIELMRSLLVEVGG